MWISAAQTHHCQTSGPPSLNFNRVTNATEFDPALLKLRLLYQQGLPDEFQQPIAMPTGEELPQRP